jgi:integrase
MSLRLVRRGRSPHYYVRGAVRGIRIFQTTGTDDPKIADAFRIRLESELLHRSIFGVAATVTFAEAAVSYLQAGGEARFLGRYDEKSGKWTLLIGHFLDTAIGKIGQDETDQAAYKLYPNATAATRKRQVYTPMAAVLHHAAGKGWIRAPAIKQPKVKQPETRYSSVDRLNKLLPHCSAKLRSLIVFLPYTGARISECLRVNWERDIDLARRTVTLRRTKNGKPRTVHLADPVMTELAGVPEPERRGQVFKWKARSAVYKPLQRACRLAGVEYLPTHQQGRHTFAAWLRIDGKRDLVGLKADGGWDSIQSVMRYEHLVPGESVEAVNRLPKVQSVCTKAIAAAKPAKIKRKSR